MAGRRTFGRCAENALIPITPQRETPLVAAALKTLIDCGCLAWRNNTGAANMAPQGKPPRWVRFGVPGLPDILGVLPGGRGRLLAIECKRLAGKASQKQRRMLQNLALAGAAVCVLRDSCDGLAEWVRENAQ